MNDEYFYTPTVGELKPACKSRANQLGEAVFMTGTREKKSLKMGGWDEMRMRVGVNCYVLWVAFPDGHAKKNRR